MLWRGGGLKQLDYAAANIKTSDHRPVSSMFDCTISIVDEGQKDKLNRILYDRHRAEFGAMISKGDLLEDDDDTARSFANSQGVPPASSDRQKWWLDNGRGDSSNQPMSSSFANGISGSGARSAIAPLVQGNVPNIVGISNPFIQSEEDEWVKPQVLLDIADSRVAVADSPMSKPQRPRKPVALSQPVLASPTGLIEAHRDVSGVINDEGGEPKPRLPPRPPTWETVERNSPQPIKWSATAMPTSTNLLDEMDPAMDKWKPLLPYR